MSELLIYLVKVNISLILFYLGYHFWLKKLTFFNLNRFYLLFSLIFSSCYPTVDLSKVFFPDPKVKGGILTVMPDWQHVQFVKETMGWNEYIEGSFWISFSLLLIRLLIKLSGIVKIHRSSITAEWSGYNYRASTAITSPFSFLRNIYINPVNHTEADFEKILKHESIHVRQFHSLDILLSEIAILFFWYNPVCWMMKTAVAENIEFITDKKVIASGIEKQSYQYSLVNICSLSGKRSVLRNHFNLKNLKKRIMMMNKKETTRRHVGKYLFIVPLIVFSSFIFSVSRAYVHPINSTISKKIIAEIFEEPMPDDPYDSLKHQFMNVKDISSLQVDDNILILLDGKKINNAQLKNLKGYQLGEICVYKGEYAKDIYGEEGEDGVIVISTTENAEQSDSEIDEIRTKYFNTSADNPIYILDGKEITKKEFKALKAENIKEIEVIKGDHVLNLYGERGKGGVINIRTKE